MRKTISQRKAQPMRWATPGSIVKRIARDEGQTTEFKESFSLEPKIIEAICAFANSRGGWVLVGVRHDQTIVGAHLGANTLENFANNEKRRNEPPVLPEIAPVHIDGRIVVGIRVDPVGQGEVVRYDGRALKRTGKTNQLMSGAEQRKKSGFRRENSLRNGGRASHRAAGFESWHERERRRVDAYERNRGLFLVHSWQPSEEAGQIADIVVRLEQHPGADQPLSDGNVKYVEYYLGPRFFKNTVTKTDASDGFRLDVSAYAPALCMAVVHFDDRHDPIELKRYLDFQ